MGINARDPGDYRSRVTIEQIKDDADTDEYREVDITDDDNWETYFGCAADVETTGTTSRRINGVVHSEANLFVLCRASTKTKAITTDMRVQTQDGRTAAIKGSYANDQFGNEQRIECLETLT